jgi:hypothetical protein
MKLFTLLFLVFTLSFLTISCEEAEADGVEQVGDDIEDGIEDAGDDIEDGAEEVGDDLEDGLED